MSEQNPFATIGGVDASRDSNYVNPGHYIMRIDAVKMKENRKGDDIFIVEQTPLHVLAAEECMMNKAPTRSNKPGITCSHLIPFAGPGKDMALPNVKAFAETVVEGFAENPDKQAALMLVITGDKQPLAGLMVEVVARSIVTRSGSDFTKVVYVEVVDNAWRLERELITPEQFELLSAEG